MPSASEFGPSDDALAAFGKNALAMLLGMGLGLVGTGLVLMQGQWGQALRLGGLGLLLGLPVALVTGFASAVLHPQFATRRRAHLVNGAIWLGWTIISVLVLQYFDLVDWHALASMLLLWLPPAMITLVFLQIAAWWIWRTEPEVRA